VAPATTPVNPATSAKQAHASSTVLRDRWIATVNAQIQPRMLRTVEVVERDVLQERSAPAGHAIRHANPTRPFVRVPVSTCKPAPFIVARAATHASRARSAMRAPALCFAKAMRPNARESVPT
jgi:hypothetical protein